MNLPNKITLTRILLIPVFAVFFFVEAIPQNYFCLLYTSDAADEL